MLLVGVALGLVVWPMRPDGPFMGVLTGVVRALRRVGARSREERGCDEEV